MNFNSQINFSSNKRIGIGATNSLAQKIKTFLDPTSIFLCGASQAKEQS